MTTQNLPKNLPFLPGNVYADPTITRYHKTQILGLQNGVITGKFPTTLMRYKLTNFCILEKLAALKEPVNAELLASMRSGGAISHYG